MANRSSWKNDNLFDRMEGLSNVKQHEALTTLITSLSVEWLNEGFEEIEIREYIDYLTRVQLKKI
jgi:hypothetical protein